MSVPKFLKVAAAAAAMTAMPMTAIAQSPAAALSVASSVSATAVQDDDDGFGSVTRYLIPGVIVVVLLVGIYFAFIEDDDSISA